MIYVDTPYLWIGSELEWEERPFALLERTVDNKRVFWVMTDDNDRDPYERIHDALQNIRPFETTEVTLAMKRYTWTSPPKAGFWHLDDEHIMLLQMIVPDLIK